MSEISIERPAPFLHRIRNAWRTFRVGAPMGEISKADPYLLYGGKPVAFNPNELISTKGYEVIDRMRRDDQVKAALAFKKQSVLAAGWTVKSPEGQDEKWEPRVEVQRSLYNCKGGFTRALKEVLSALDYGFSVGEKVWEEKDGKIRLSKLAVRKPHFIDFGTDDHGNLVNVEQLAQSLPIDKLVIYTYDYEFSNYYGRTDLDAAYRAWWTKNNSYKWMAMMMERLGIPPIFALYNDGVYTGAKQTKLIQILSSLQAASTGAIPRPTKDDLEFWSPELAGQVTRVFIPALEFMNKDISRALLMPGLLGMTQDEATGSLARSRVHFDVFLLVLEDIRSQLQELVNETIVEDILMFNFPQAFEDEEKPYFEFLPLTDDVRLDILEKWQTLVGGKVVQPQDSDEVHIRNLLKFPEMDQDDVDERAERKVEAARSLFPTAGPGGPPVPPDPDEDEDEEETRETQQIQKSRTDKIDYQAITRRLNGLEEESSVSLIGAIQNARIKLVERVREEFRSNSTTADWVTKLDVRSWAPVRTALREMAGAAFTGGRQDLRREVTGQSDLRVSITPREAARFMDERMFWVSGVMRDDITKRAQTVLMQAIKNGEPLDETIEKLNDIFAPYVGAEVEGKVVKPSRLETIVRTNLTEAYNQGRLAEIHDPDLKEFIEGVRYSAVIDSRTTEVCEFLHDKVFREDEPDLDRIAPPNHFNCRSVLVPLIVGVEEIKDFAGSEEIDEALKMISEGFGGDKLFAQFMQRGKP